jgi:ubiquinol-cytochrome c reductase cytochrome b subunit
MFLIVFCGVIFFAPDGGNMVLEKPNFEEANPQVTPPEITPAWYFGVFYAMLRATPSMFHSALPGVIVMFSAVVILFFLPWLDRSPVKSIRYKGPIFKVAVTLFAIAFVVLNYLGMQPVSPMHTLVARIGTIYYFLFFLGMPIYSRMDSTKPEPERVTS